MIEANWLIFLAALAIGLLVAYWIFVHGSKSPRQRSHRRDVLDEGAAPAQRNQALIDSASPASQYDLPVPDLAGAEAQPAHIDPPAAAGIMAGIGEVIAVAAQEEADEARAFDEARREARNGAGQDAGTGMGSENLSAAEAPIEPAPSPEPEPKPAAAPEPTPASSPAAAEEPPVAPLQVSGEPDDLRKIKGLGPKMQKLLVALGVTRFAQIAAWTDADLDDLDTKLGAFAGRPRRDKWVEQARFLASGDTAAYEAEFGKI